MIQELNGRLIGKKLVKLLPQVSTHDIDLVNSQGNTLIQQPVDNPFSLYPHQWLQRDRKQPVAKSRREKNSPLDAVLFKGSKPGGW